MHMVCAEGSLPAVDVGRAERLSMVLTGMHNSTAGHIYSTVSLIVTAVLIGIVSMGGVWSCPRLEAVCMVFVTLEYMSLMTASLFSRHELFDEDRLLEAVVPEKSDANAPLAADWTPLQRLRTWFLMWGNLLDLITILPWWLELYDRAALSNNFPAFRVLRLFRAFRILRVAKLGKWSATLAVLFTTMTHSVRIIGSLVLIVVCISALCGVLLQQLEYPVPDGLDEKVAKANEAAFGNVFSCMLYVTGRIFTMGSSLPDANGRTTQMLSEVVILFLGIFKGVLLVLPIGAITEKYKHANDVITAQVDQVTAMRADWEKSRGVEWAFGIKGASARVELFPSDEDEDSEDEDSLATEGVPRVTGALNLPLFEAKPIQVTLQVSLNSAQGCCQGSGAEPRLEVALSWQPAGTLAGAAPPGPPRGSLEVEILRASDLGGLEEQHWRCRLKVPTALYGSGAPMVWTSPVSDEPGPSPEWSGARQNFAVEWKGQDNAGAAGLLEILQSQSQKIAALERGAPL
ncbi:unnamed protein product [Prorocentrum cordatum]|uniref:Ion transport domain-containing protein n=1 Tax=Prorocentrum cordatum TaxID=2364126 RepID=A0ABN9P9D6_9DINO|nr:unnamed protein product [Polarella glacialis]